MKKLYITKHKGSKMDGMTSVNFGFTEACHKRAKIDGSVCQRCYAMKACKNYCSKANARYQNNRDMLMSGMSPDFKRSVKTVRINAIGEVGSIQEELEYFRICNENPDILFVQWTKEIGFLYGAMSKENKPKNLRLIFSGLMVNRVVPLIPAFDHTFTVWDIPPLDAYYHQCAGMKCKECMYCYQENKGEKKHIVENLR